MNKSPVANLNGPDCRVSSDLQRIIDRPGVTIIDANTGRNKDGQIVNSFRAITE
jgi:hypothetical protein